MLYYELDFLTPNLEIKEREDLIKTIEEEIKKLNGTVKNKLIEKKLFAYPVKKHQSGFLGVVSFTMNEGNKIKELNDFLKLNEKILRSIIERTTDKSTKPERRRRPILEQTKEQTKTKVRVKKEKVKIEELDQKLDEMLK